MKTAIIHNMLMKEMVNLLFNYAEILFSFCVVLLLCSELTKRDKKVTTEFCWDQLKRDHYVQTAQFSPKLN
jgi:hypothetical protein